MAAEPPFAPVRELLRAAARPGSRALERRRGRHAAYAVAAGLSVFGAVSSLEYARYGGWALTAGLLCASAVGAGVVLALRRGARTEVAGHFGIAAMLGAALSLGAFGGGYYDSGFTMAWMVPIVAGLLVGFAGSLVWAAATAASVAGMWWATENGALPPSAIPDAFHATQGLSDGFWYVLAGWLVTAGYLAAQRRADDELLAVQAALEEEVRVRRDAELRATAADRAKGRFLATMSHELRTPMHGVLGMAELLAACGLAPEQRKWIDALRASGQSLLAILDEVLDFSKIEAGALDVTPAPFPLRDHVEETVRSLAATAQLKGLELRVDVEAALPAWVVGDAGRLRQILVNLVGNAVKFTERGSVVVRARALREGATAWLVITVEDTGIGVAADDRDLLFEPFRQVDESPERRRGGTGLGLAISRRLAEALGGSLDVESTPGVGSTFTLRCPLVATTEPTGASPPTGTSEPPPTSGRPLDVLVVDDDPTNRLVARAMLRRFGHRVTEATNGAEAVEAVALHRYDIVLLDAQMPVMGGLEAARRIREAHGADAPRLVALTANVMEGAREEALAAGMDDYLGKPFRPAELARCLERRPA